MWKKSSKHEVFLYVCVSSGSILCYPSVWHVMYQLYHIFLYFKDFISQQLYNWSIFVQLYVYKKQMHWQPPEPGYHSAFISSLTDENSPSPQCTLSFTICSISVSAFEIKYNTLRSSGLNGHAHTAPVVSLGLWGNFSVWVKLIRVCILFHRKM